MAIAANCELGDSDEHDVMYSGFEASEDDWNFYERVRLRRDLSDPKQCLDGNQVKREQCCWCYLVLAGF